MLTVSRDPASYFFDHFVFLVVSFFLENVAVEIFMHLQQQ